MTEFAIKLAGIPIKVKGLYPSTAEFCNDYLTDEEPEFTVHISQEDIDFEREKSAMEDEYEGRLVRHYTDRYLETLAVYRKIVVKLLDYNIFLFHGCVVAVGDNAYLFTAKSGTGKTTHTRLWLKNIPGSYIVNGDKPLLKVTDGGVIACASPWQGKEGYGTNVSVPLKAVCILERDKNNHIEAIEPKDAFTMLYQQAYRPSGNLTMMKTLELIDSLSSKVKLFKLGCNMEDEAAFVAYNAMKD